MTTLTKAYPLSRSVLLVFIGSIALALSAQLSIPLLPVPVTFQTMALLGLAVFLGPNLACAAVIAYLVEAAAGLPVFAEFQNGLPLGPQGGYLLAMIPAAYFAGWIAQKRSFMHVVLAGLVLALITLSIGTSVLAHFIGVSLAFKVGFKPFILIEVIKVLAVAAGVALSTRLSKKSA